MKCKYFLIILFFVYLGCRNAPPVYKYSLGQRVYVKTTSPNELKGVVDEQLQKHAHNYYKVRTPKKVITIPEECIIKAF